MQVNKIKNSKLLLFLKCTYKKQIYEKSKLYFLSIIINDVLVMKFDRGMNLWEIMLKYETSFFIYTKDEFNDQCSKSSVRASYLSCTLVYWLISLIDNFIACSTYKLNIYKFLVLFNFKGAGSSIWLAFHFFFGDV